VLASNERCTWEIRVYTDKKGYNNLLGILRYNRDKEVSTLVWLAMEKHCGPDSGQPYGLVERTIPTGEYYFEFSNIEMTVLLSRIDGNPERGRCISNWYFRTEGTVRKITEIEKKNPGITKQQLLEALIRRECGAP